MRKHYSISWGVGNRHWRLPDGVHLCIFYSTIPAVAPLTLDCFYSCSRTYSGWFARFRILQGSRGTKPSSDDLSYQLQGFLCSLLSSNVNIRTHMPCQERDGFPGEVAMTLEARVRLEACLVHIQLPPSLPRAWFWHACSLAPCLPKEVPSPRSEVSSTNPLQLYRIHPGVYTHSSSPAFPTGLPSLPRPHLDPDNFQGFHIGRAKQCVVLRIQGRVRNRAALGSASCKYWQLQIKVLRVADIDTTV